MSTWTRSARPPLRRLHRLRHDRPAIIFSHDTDPVPAVEMLRRLNGLGCIETASWTSGTFNRRIRTNPPIHHHSISQAVFDRVETRVNYAHS